MAHSSRSSSYSEGQALVRSSPPIPPSVNLSFHRLMKDLFTEESEGKRTLNLCAYDNVLSENAKKVLSLELGVRYRLGSLAEAPSLECSRWNQKGSLFFGTLPGLERLEKAALLAAQKLFGGVGADLRPLSGVHATMATLLSVCPPGGTVASIAPSDGGHFATRDVVERSGRKSLFIPWCQKTQQPDLAGLTALNQAQPIDVIFLDPGCPMQPLPIREIRSLMGPSPYLVYDASHTLGLMAGGQFQDPIAEGADVLQGNTHKSFPGPQKALMIYGSQRAKDLIRAGLDAGLVSSQHTHDLMALSITLLEMEAFGKEYAETLIENARELKRCLKERGVRVFGPDETHTHIVLLEFENEKESQEAFKALLKAGMTTNARVIFSRPLIRIGVQEITRRGFMPKEMGQIAEWMTRAAGDPEGVRAEVGYELARRTQIAYSFD